MTVDQALLMFISGGATGYLIAQWGREPKSCQDIDHEMNRPAPDPRNKILNAPKPKHPGAVDFGEG